MKRTKGKDKLTTNKKKLTGNQIQRAISDIISRRNMFYRMGLQYEGNRKIYEALGYPTDTELTFGYFYGKYDRQDIAETIINKPVDKAWNSFQYIMEKDVPEDESKLKEAWTKLEKRLKITHTLNKLDKLMGIGYYAVLLLGYSDLENMQVWKTPLRGKPELRYIKAIAESAATITEWEKAPKSARFGKPTMYEITLNSDADAGKSQTFQVHHSRVIHVATGSLDSETYGRPRLKPIINRLIDLEKILGGSAEMYWRGARPGYAALSKDDFEWTEDIETDLIDQLEDYENDLRRFLTLQGVDIKALEQQVADPLKHIDAQLQAISANTGIPKRILIGSERGELASSQDKDAWLALVKTRCDDFCTPIILEPFVEKLMETGALPKIEDWIAEWEDLFAPSDKEKAEVGKIKSETLKNYGDSLSAQDILPTEMFLKYLMGFDDDEVVEIMTAIEDMVAEEDRQMAESEEEVQMVVPAQQNGNGNGTGLVTPQKMQAAIKNVNKRKRKR